MTPGYAVACGALVLGTYWVSSSCFGCCTGCYACGVCCNLCWLCHFPGSIYQHLHLGKHRTCHWVGGDTPPSSAPTLALVPHCCNKYVDSAGVLYLCDSSYTCHVWTMQDSSTRPFQQPALFIGNIVVGTVCLLLIAAILAIHVWRVFQVSRRHKIW